MGRIGNIVNNLFWAYYAHQQNKSRMEAEGPYKEVRGQKYAEDWNQLFIFANENKLEELKNLFPSAPSFVTAKDSNGFDLLQVAISNNSIDVAKYLISEESSHFDFNHQNNRGVNILHIISINGDLEILDCLIKNNKVPNCDLVTSEMESAIFLAVSNNHIDFLSKLIAHLKESAPEKLKEVINYQNSHGVSALLLSVLRNDIQTAKLLIDSGASVNVVRKDGSSPLHIACTFEDASTDLVKLLLDNGADVTLENTFGWSPLHQAHNNKDFIEKYEFLRSYLTQSDKKVYLDSFDPEKKKVIPKQE
ncbi:hypothetical protein DICPUDRAFT_156446 [Dictyostelium purpureum]|uniref:Uncharacterized protein n=1 Tax=Dictyostelium purpureum TaxID=5786 RepID=F0ZWL3_DICPU|nr:uncharacterized protein DICPUDRAFT_156446 [Dictyostelium purpureum]EGC31670.1 hypothetical protein DICPUDRAFT_156446 [Dictyostelium purpureum]|eukprot:XP_003291801.1 hypothetical protein DICPUDRAFT_156446 [Dictyostelium purpureum]